MATTDGGQAFPGVRADRMHVGGMSLRDYFAAKAMQAMLVHHVRPIDPDDKIAKRAYEVADAMLIRGRGL